MSAGVLVQQYLVTELQESNQTKSHYCTCSHRQVCVVTSSHKDTWHKARAPHVSAELWQVPKQTLA